MQLLGVGLAYLSCLTQTSGTCYSFIAVAVINYPVQKQFRRTGKTQGQNPNMASPIILTVKNRGR